MSNNVAMITEMLGSIDTLCRHRRWPFSSLLNIMERSSMGWRLFGFSFWKSRLRNTTYMNHSITVLKGKVGWRRRVREREGEKRAWKTAHQNGKSGCLRVVGSWGAITLLVFPHLISFFLMFLSWHCITCAINKERKCFLNQTTRRRGSLNYQVAQISKVIHNTQRGCGGRGGKGRGK